MSKNLDANEYKIIDLDNKFEKIVYIVENEEERIKRLKSQAENKIINSGVVNINNIKNCGSLYIKDFEIKYLREGDINKPRLCSFNTLPENINPLLTEKFEKKKKRFIDLKIMQNTEENIRKLFSLDSE